MSNALRFLAIDAIERAGSGHPGMPMGMADVSCILWGKYLKHNPLNPNWVNRDRFVISNGHGSMLLYALLHLTGYGLNLDEIRNFRQLHSKTPGHPEVDVTPGVETTTGPLGQGLANAVGMALAEKLLSNEFNKPGYPVIDHKTFVFLGDGCLMEGISHEACSLASLWGLSKLICFYDSNGISIDGKVDPWFNENVKQRFNAYGWNVIGPIDGHDFGEISKSISNALEHSTNSDKKNSPTLIICKTIIGKGSPNRQNTSKAHGESLGEEEISETRKNLDWHHAPFVIPENIRKSWNSRKFGRACEGAWKNLFKSYRSKYPELSKKLKLRVNGNYDKNLVDMGFKSLIKKYNSELPNIATRKASQNILNFLGPNLDLLIGGSADLTGSNLTNWKDAVPMRISEDGSQINGRHINFGVREFGMSAICSGLALHGGFIPFCGTFLTFSDYSRNAIRMAAMMKIRVIFIFTHDSIGLGEDGPTHQAVEHASSLRLLPNLNVWRPADSVEVAIAWKEALNCENGPTAILLSRQKLKCFKRNQTAIKSISYGAYLIRNVKSPDILIVATGSELYIAEKSAETLKKEYNVNVGVVSIPSTTEFDKQTVQFKEKILPLSTPKIIIEAGTTDFWWKYKPEAVLGIDSFGESAPGQDLYNLFGITEETVIKTALIILNNAK